MRCIRQFKIFSVLPVLLLALFLFFPQGVSAAVVINEFQIDPGGASQWAELYNTGPDAVDMSGWFIDDEGGTEKFTIPQGTLLQSNYCISFQSGNFNWNTSSSDSARLLSDSLVIDEYDFSGSSGNGTSFGRNPDGTGGWTTFSSPTRDKLNSNATSCAASPTATATNTPTKTPTPTQSASTPTPTTFLQPSPTLSPTISATKPLSPTVKKSPTPSTLPSPEAGGAPEVLGIAISPTTEVVATSSGRVRTVLPLIIAFLFIAMGLLVLALVLIIKKRHVVSMEDFP